MNSFFSRVVVTQSFKTAISALLLLGFLGTVSAFTDPSLPPPNGNVPAPINVGPVAQKKEGSILVGSAAASPAGSGSLVTSGNMYTANTSNNDAIFAGELTKAKSDFPNRNLFGIGWNALSGQAGFFGTDFRVMDSANNALLKNIFAGKVYADDFWIGSLNTWASKLAGSIPGAPATPNLQQVTEAGASTNKDVVFQGNVWFAKSINSSQTVLNPENDPNTGVYSNKAINTASTMAAKDIWIGNVQRNATQQFPIGTTMQTVEVNSYPSGYASATSNKSFCALSKTRIASDSFGGGDSVECRIEGGPGNWTVIAQRIRGTQTQIVCGAICFGN